MTPNRLPWWILLAAAGYLGYLTLMAWCGAFGPEDPGFLASFEAGELTITSVGSGSPAARAGLLAGDVIRPTGGGPLTSRFDWMAFSGRWRSNQQVQLDVSRGGQSFQSILDIRARRWRDAGAASIVAASLMWGIRWLTLLAGFLILLRGRNILISRLGAWFLASASVASVVLIPGMAATWRAVPAVLATPLWIPALGALSLPAIFFTFLASFPAMRIRRRLHWGLVWLPQALLLALVGRYLFFAVYLPGRSSGLLPIWFAYLYVGVALTYLAAALALQAVNHWNLEGANDRRCAGFLFTGALAGWVASIPIVVLDWQGRAASIAPSLFTSTAAIVAAAAFLACLILVTSIMLRRRVFGFQLMVRMGLRYALARKFLISLTPVCLLLLVVDLVLHGDQPLIVIVQARGWGYLVLAALALLAQSRRERWLVALDRRFFRERYQSEQLLRQIAELVLQSKDLSQAAGQIVSKIVAALHAEWVAVLVRDPASSTYRSIAAAPKDSAPDSLPADLRLISLVRALGKPVELSISSKWLRAQLPHEETEFIRTARMELLVPFTVAPGAREALFLAGPRLSEEPYTNEDQDLLSAIAANLALLPEGVSTHTVPMALPYFQECAVCGNCYDEDRTTCPDDSGELEVRLLPRVLTGRYRIDRRLGAGGMGTVYRAFDLELERAVAVKIIHDSLINSASGAARFRREARAAAAFSHPNIITVYDFGIAGAAHAYLVMELLHGQSLRDFIPVGTGLNAPEVSSVLRGVCDAVEAAHRKQMIHRDLKPENIFLAQGDQGLQPKVLDFGIVKLLGDQHAAEPGGKTVTGSLLGTFRYMSPEQLAGGEPHPGWDLWALAVIALEMMTGVHPFQDFTPYDWQHGGREGHATRAEMSASRLAHSLQDFFRDALARDPARRPPTAVEFFNRLDRALQSSQPMGPPSGPHDASREQ